MKTAFICFFPVYPTNMGSAEVVRSLFLCWPGEKKLFQISHIKNIQNKNCQTFQINIEKPILKIINIPKLVFKSLNYLKNSRKKIVFLEGPSWIGYSFLTLILIKIFSPTTKVIYHSHSVEYEVRKMMSSKLTAFFTKILEKIVFKFADLSTAVSDIEKKKIKSLYNVDCINLKNGISGNILKFNKKRTLHFHYIIYCGSYKYPPNKEAIDYIVQKIMPTLSKKYPKLKLVLTGGGYKKKERFLINMGIVKKEKLLNLIYNSKFMLVPLMKGTGTRIKIIEALLINANVITTKKGIEGIDYNNAKNVIVANRNNFLDIIQTNYKKNKKVNKINKYLKNYTMEKIVKDFLGNNNVKNII